MTSEYGNATKQKTHVGRYNFTSQLNVYELGALLDLCKVAEHFCITHQTLSKCNLLRNIRFRRLGSVLKGEIMKRA